MATLTSPRSPLRSTPALLLGVALLLAGCGDSGSRPGSPVTSAGTPATDPGTTTNVADPSAPQTQAEAPETTDDGDSETTQQEPPAGSRGTATLKVDDAAFDFELAFCSIGEEDVLLHGPGKDAASGQIAYLDVDFVWVDDKWHGEVRANLGTDQQFSSPDEFYVFSTERTAQQLGGNVAVMNMFSVDGDFRYRGEDPVMDGQLEVNCN